MDTGEMVGTPGLDQGPHHGLKTGQVLGLEVTDETVPDDPQFTPRLDQAERI
jgi:hypothetical protein